jgi:MFS family permease
MVGNIMAAIAAMLCALYIFPFGGGDIVSFLLLSFTAFFIECGNSISMGGYSGLGPEVSAGRIGLLAGLMAIGRSVGMLSSSTAAGFLLDFVPYPMNFILCYALYAFLLIFCWATLYFFVHEPKNAKVKKFSPGSFIKSFWIFKKGYFNFYMIFFNRFVISFLLNFQFFEMGTYSILNFIPYYFMDVQKVEAVSSFSSLFLFIILGLAGVVGPISGIFSDYAPIPRKWFVFIAGFITSFSFILFLAVTFFELHVAFFFICSGILGIGVGVYLSVDWALAIDSCPIEEDIAKDMGIWNLSSSVASLLSPFVTGIILDRLKRMMDIRYAWCFVFGTGAFWYAFSSFLLLVVTVKPKKKEDTPEEEQSLIKE